MFSEKSAQAVPLRIHHVHQWIRILNKRKTHAQTETEQLRRDEGRHSLTMDIYNVVDNGDEVLKTRVGQVVMVVVSSDLTLERDAV